MKIHQCCANPWIIVACISLCALIGRADPQLIVWGQGAGGQTNVPASLTNVVAVAGSYQSSLALQRGGSAVAWGNSGPLTDSFPNLTDAIGIAAGTYHGVAFRADGTVVAWGNNAEGQTNVPAGLTGVVGLSGGNGHTLALQSDGRITAWGRNDRSQCNPPPELSNVVAVAAGGVHSLALMADGSVVGWGDNTFHQTEVPVQLTNAVAIAAGYEHNLALKADGTLAVWGTTSYGRGSIPADLTNVQAVAAGESHSLALKGDGTVVAWGANHYAQTDVPASLTNAVATAGGTYHSLAILGEGAPFITTSLTRRTAIAGTTVYFRVASVGRGPLQYQWQRNGTNLPGATQPILVLNNLQPDQGGDYSVVVGNSLGQSSSSNTLQVLDIVVFKQHPQNRSVTEWQNVTLEAQAVGRSPLSYQWRFNGTNLSGATDRTLTLANIQLGQAGAYSVAASNATAWNISSNALLTVSPPTILVQPQSQVAYAGSNATITVTVAGDGPFNYQWRFAGGALMGATQSSLALSNLQLSNAGPYSVTVSNAFGGSFTSSDVNLTVIPFSISAQPQPKTALLLGSVTFSVGVKGVGPFRYQWRFNGVAVPNATNSSLALPALQSDQAGSYSVVISNAFGFMESAGASLSVNQILVLGNNNAGGQLAVPPIPTNAIALAAGDYHCVALLADRTLATWGSFAQTNVPADVTNVFSLGAGSTHTLALRGDGSVKLLGRILFGGTTTVPAELTNAVAVALGPGAQHAVALRADGVVVDWGGGSSSAMLTNVPVTATNLVSIAGGASHTVALRADGRVVAWGDNSRGQTNVPASATNIVAIAAGWYHNLALRANGSLLAWGLSLPPISPYNGTNFVDIACGGNHIIALRRDGTMVTYADSTAVPANATNLAAIAGGSYNTLALVGTGPPIFPAQPVPRVVASGATAYLRLTAFGALPLRYRWSFDGTNIAGATNSFLPVANAQPSQSGNYTLVVSNAFGVVTNTGSSLTVVPVMIAAQPRNQAAYSGATVTFSVAATGQGPLAYQWRFQGTNLLGATNSSLILSNVQSGDVGEYSALVSNVHGSAVSSSAMLTVAPILITSQPTSQVVFRGGSATFSIAAQSSQPIHYQWQFNGTDIPGGGSNRLTLASLDYHQTGDYSVILSNALAVTNGRTTSLAVVPVATWGRNGSNPTNTPPDLTNIIAIAAGQSHSLALKTDHSVVAWNTTGKLLGVPPDLTNIVAISVGDSHSLALRADGTVAAWGLNNSGQINVPSGLTNVVAIAAGGYFSLALKNDGTIAAWGQGSQGQTNAPLNLTNVVAISAGSSHSLALTSEGLVAGWGYNGTGQTDIPPGLSNVLAVAAGQIHSLALKGDGAVTVWGSSGYGLGNIPPTATNIVAVSAGYGHCLALRADGEVFAWGYHYNGETNLPANLHVVTMVSAGNFYNLALVGDGPRPQRVQLENPTLSANGFTVLLPSQSGRVYRLEYKHSLSETTWVALPLVAGSGETLTLTDPNPASTQRLYRVRQW